VIEYLCNGKNFKNVIAVIFDSVTQMMCTDLMIELLEQADDARSDDDKKEKALFSKAKMTKEGYGVIATNMMRLMRQLELMSRRGRYVIVTSLSESSPSWSTTLDMAPAVSGKKFGTIFPGKCDFIGYVQRRKDKITKRKIYPPAVSYETKTDTYLAKWTGLWPIQKGERIAPIKLPLDFSILFPNVLNNTKTDTEKPEV